MSDKELENSKVFKSGTEYITIRVPKKYFRELPEGYFYADIIIKNPRGGKK